jgi:CBS domain-containing protein
MKKRTPVSKIMTSQPITVNETNNISDVAQIFKERNIHHIPVVSGPTLIGMISKTDIDRISFVTGSQDEKANTSIYKNLTIDQIMTKNVESVQSSDTIKEAAELLARGSYHALPVLENGNLQGIVTSTDVINYLLEQY